MIFVTHKLAYVKSAEGHWRITTCHTRKSILKLFKRLYCFKFKKKEERKTNNPPHLQLKSQITQIQRSSLSKLTTRLTQIFPEN